MVATSPQTSGVCAIRPDVRKTYTQDLSQDYCLEISSLQMLSRSLLKANSWFQEACRHAPNRNRLEQSLLPTRSGIARAAIRDLSPKRANKKGRVLGVDIASIVAHESGHTAASYSCPPLC